MKKVFLTLAGILSFMAYAVSADAVIDKTSGDVRICVMKGLKVLRLVSAKPGMDLDAGDIIQARQGGMVHVKFANGNVILVKGVSRFRIKGDAKKRLIDFEQGEFLIGVKHKLAADESFVVKTPAAVAAVRGTLFWGRSDEDLNSVFACFESELDVTAMSITRRLKPGEKVEIDYEKPPGLIQPAGLTPEYFDTFSVDNSIQGIKDMLK